MNLRGLLSSVLIGAVASARSMTPMAALSVARLAGRRTPGRLVLLDRPVVKFGALAMGAGELLGDKMKTAPDRTVFLGLLARVMSAGIAGAALAPQGSERAGAAAAVGSRPAGLRHAGRPQAGHGPYWADAQRADRRRAGRRGGDCRRGVGDAAQALIAPGRKPGRTPLLSLRPLRARLLHLGAGPPPTLWLARPCHLSRAVHPPPETIMSIGAILLVIVILLLVGAFPAWPHSRGWGYGPTGGLGLVLLILVVLLLMGRL